MGGKGSGGANRKPVEQKIRIGNPGGRALPKADVIAFPVQKPLNRIDLWGRWVLSCGNGCGWLLLRG
jgi:hypothetical protein